VNFEALQVMQLRVVEGGATGLCGCRCVRIIAASPDSRIQEAQPASSRIIASEQQCMDQAVKRAHDEIAQFGQTPDASVGQGIQAIDAERDHNLSLCKAAANRANEELSAREQAEYQQLAREENARLTMLRLIATPPP
jgi:hypothetical protein